MGLAFWLFGSLFGSALVERYSLAFEA